MEGQIQSLQEHLSGTRTELDAALEEMHAAEKQLRETEARVRHYELLLKTVLSAQKHPERELAREIPRLDDRLFAEHARAFRGDRAEIKRRLDVYMPHARAAWQATGNLPALDLGCGRGEWLEVLKEAGIPARGIDSNRELIAACRELDLEACEGDLPQMLRSIPDNSHAIVSAIHVLEHLAFPDLLEVVDHAVRILKPGGIAIFETPNPKNLFVSSNSFYLDPTHHHPLPSEFLAFILSARGFSDPQIFPLVPYPDSYRLDENGSQAAIFINEHFFGPQDYGIIAKKALPDCSCA
jgi:O-antigen chain-terminating methyltransferase